MLRVKNDKSDWFWSQSIVLYKAIQNRNVVGPGQGSRFFQRMTKGTRGDEVVFTFVTLVARLYSSLVILVSHHGKYAPTINFLF